MPGRNVSRRLFVGMVGSGVIAAPVVASIPVTSANAADREATELGNNAQISRLLNPLVVGSRFAKWTLVQINPMVRGAVTLKVRTDDQHTFDLEILARDSSALAQKPPAETAKFAVFVVNGGDGWSPTIEDQGLAAMTLAQIVRKNEQAVELSGLLTHAERIRQHADALLVSASRSAS